MRALSLGLVAIFACKGGDRAAAPPPPPADAPAPRDAGPPPVDALFDDAAVALAPEEAARRADRATGLAAPDARAEVLTESLIVALATGRASLSAYVDEVRGAWTLAHTDDPRRDQVARRCGPAARDLAADNLGRVVDRQIGGAGAQQLACDNTFIATPPTPGNPRAGLGPHATCRSPGADPGATSTELVFAPAADGGLRFVAALELRPDRPADRLWRALATAIARAGDRCR
ncbi:MAG: hypothetical protein IPL61_34835 [Myxococcales bacterium]|nr:hypothetical protein [Myxococcales bacterium]